MGSRNVVRLFFSTLFIGGVGTAIISLFARWDDYGKLLTNGRIAEFGVLFLWFIGIGMMFSVMSQMGFFAYLTVHRIGLGFFRSESRWNIVQVVLILVAIGDFLYFQHVFHQHPLLGIHLFSVACIVALAFLTAYVKAKQTNQHAFLPALFFMIVVTMIEWIPGILADDNNRWLYFMLYPLLICNMYQLLMLHRLQKKPNGSMSSKRHPNQLKNING